MDYLRKVKFDGYYLETWDTHRQDSRGQTRIGYRLIHPDGRTLFDGEDFCGSPLHADDSDDTVRSLLGFLTLRPGDTDRDYFDNYTPEQLEWAESEAEYLSLYADEESAMPFEEIES